MREKSDAQMLREYAEHGNEAAFHEIVARHADVIYSSALRQATSPDLARDITQSVFTDLARKARPLAKSLAENASLLGWLFRGARFAALNQLREDRRRQARERQAMENYNPAPGTETETAPEWERVRPILDDAMADLSDADRDALLLRFFKNQDFRAVGESLGVSDDTAQKRVSRALERLRAEFSRRGVTTTAAALSTALSAHAVTTAPAGLAAALSTAALSGTNILATATVVQTIAMTTIQKAIITAAIAAVVGVGIYGERRISSLQGEIQALQQQQAPLVEQIRQLQLERDDATNRLAQRAKEQTKSGENTAELLRLRAEVTRLRADANNPMDTAAKALIAKVNNLKSRLEATPGAKIPELQLLAEKDWLNAANRKLDTDTDYRRALSSLRDGAEEKFVAMLQPAVSQFMKANSQQFPSDLAQLQPYFTSPVDAAILQRWAILPASTVENLGEGGDSIITQKAPVDDLVDLRWAIGPSGYGTSDYLSSEVGDTLKPVYKAFYEVNNGQASTDPSQLLPYATTPEQTALIQKLIQRSQLDK